MPTETIPIALTLDVPLMVVQELVKHHLLTTLALNGHTNGQALAATTTEKEAPAPVLPSSAGAP